jgi:hypothetical protein
MHCEIDRDTRTKAHRRPEKEPLTLRLEDIGGGTPVRLGRWPLSIVISRVRRKTHDLQTAARKRSAAP